MKVSLLLRSVILSREDDEGFLTISDYGDLALPKWSEILLPRLRDQDDRLWESSRLRSTPKIRVFGSYSSTND